MNPRVARWSSVMDQLQLLERRCSNAMLLSEQLERKVSAVQTMAETVFKEANAVIAEFRQTGDGKC